MAVGHVEERRVLRKGEDHQGPIHGGSRGFPRQERLLASREPDCRGEVQHEGGVRYEIHRQAGGHREAM